MTENNNQLTDMTSGWLKEHFDRRGKTGPHNPFFNMDDKLYMQYDSIRLKNKPMTPKDIEANGKGLEVGYYFRGLKVAIFPVYGTSIDFHSNSGTSASLTLNGLKGAMEIVMQEEGA
jgi:hypothetical protein